MIINVLPQWRINADKYNYSIEQLKTVNSKGGVVEKWVCIGSHHPNIWTATDRIVELVALDDNDCKSIKEHADRVKSLHDTARQYFNLESN